jgi:hypothetical protein
VVEKFGDKFPKSTYRPVLRAAGLIRSPAAKTADSRARVSRWLEAGGAKDTEPWKRKGSKVARKRAPREEAAA